jgi:hypothetical protein
MRKGLVTGVVAFLGLAGPTGSLAALSGAASSVTPAVSNVATAATTMAPGLYHQPLLGKHVLSISLGGRANTTDVQSSNWSGYADINDTFQTLSSSWVEPPVNCASTHGGLLGLGATHSAYSSFWVGLDGYTSSSVEQTGSDSDCTNGGTPSYYAWYEMYPAASVQLSTTQYPVHAGDTMTAMVMSNAAGTSFTLMLKDTVNGVAKWNFSIPETASSVPARTSAEFVAEAPSQCALIFCSELPLANFGTVTFTNAFAADTKGASGSVSAFPNAQITMSSNGKTLATPTPLAPGGGSFSVNWNS